MSLTMPVSQLSFGNFNLLTRIAAGEHIWLPEWSDLNRYVMADGKITRAGMQELAKTRPPFPALKRRHDCHNDNLYMAHWPTCFV